MEFVDGSLVTLRNGKSFVVLNGLFYEKKGLELELSPIGYWDEKGKAGGTLFKNGCDIVKVKYMDEIV